MRKISCSLIIALSTLALLSSCRHSQDKPKNNIHLTSLPSAQTGINFHNTINENDSVNLVENEYSYMGSGVSISDFNNDNLPDVFFGANPVALYFFNPMQANGCSGHPNVEDHAILANELVPFFRKLLP